MLVQYILAYTYRPFGFKSNGSELLAWRAQLRPDWFDLNSPVSKPPVVEEFEPKALTRLAPARLAVSRNQQS